MKPIEVKKIVFIHGGGNGGYAADKALVASLKTALGKEYEVDYSEIKSDESAPDFGWVKQIAGKISEINGDLILVGHSFGASMILKCLSEITVTKKIAGIFLIATPFWSGDEEWKQGLKLKENFADNLPVKDSIFFYQCLDDEETPLSHFEHYRQKIPQATFREIKSGGHQLNNDLTVVANDIKSMEQKS
jgi:predicted alpha/beta hydrolase family esterase